VKCCYNLQRRLPTFDYFPWLAHVKLLGATEIQICHGRKYFMRKKWSPEETQRRVDNYIFPGPALFGLPCKIGCEGDQEIGSHLLPDLLRDLDNREMPRIISVLPPGGAEYTVTIRNTFHKPERNSDVTLWTLFARKIGARIIDDTSKQPIGLYERVALYAGAKMNFGVSSGPMSMLWWSPFPLSEWLDPEVYGPVMEKHGISVGGQVPWLLPNQRLVWQKPTMEGLLSNV
jgi:hypothetical protein